MPHSLHQTLRTSTAALHEQLDSSIVMHSICQSEQHLADYLEDFHSALATCWLATDWGKLGLGDADLRKRRYESLSADLRNWGRIVQDLPEPRAGTLAGSVGIAYVLEGSMHGGRAILAKATSSFGEIPADRSRFLSGFGKETPRMWSGFLEWMASLPSHPAMESEACSSAKWAFGKFITSVGARAKNNVSATA